MVCDRFQALVLRALQSAPMLRRPLLLVTFSFQARSVEVSLHDVSEEKIITTLIPVTTL